MTTFITIIFVIVALIMVLTILLQSGKGGGLGSALGGGASQSVFGGAGGADFMSKMTQGFAATFMITAMYLAYASAHAGSDFLASEDEGSEGLFESDQEVNPERLGPNPLNLPTTQEGKRMQASATASVPAQSQLPDAGGAENAVENAVENGAPAEAPGLDAAEDPSAEAPGTEAGEPSPEPAAAEGSEENAAADNGTTRGDSPDQPRGDSPQGGNDSLQDSPENVPSPSPDSQPG